MKSLNIFWTLECFMTGNNIFHIFVASFIHSQSVPSKWNILYHSCFCCLFSLLIWMYWFWIGNCTQTSHNKSFNTEYFTWKTESYEQRVFSYHLVLWGEWFSFSFSFMHCILLQNLHQFVVNLLCAKYLSLENLYKFIPEKWPLFWCFEM